MSGRVLAGGHRNAPAGGRAGFSAGGQEDTCSEVSEHDQVLTAHPLFFFFVIDLNECSHEELNACSEGELCLNLEGSYQCVCPPESPTSSPEEPNCTCEGEAPGPRPRRLSGRAAPARGAPPSLQSGAAGLVGGGVASPSPCPGSRGDRALRPPLAFASVRRAPLTV